MSTQEVANRLVELCRADQFVVAIDELYDKDVVSKEPDTAQHEVVSGFDDVRAKTAKFEESIEHMHSFSVSDPIVAADHFAIVMEIDATYKGHGRMAMSEICVYEVKNGKIVKDVFFYNM